MASVAGLIRRMQTVLEQLPADYARSSGFTQRRSKLTAAAFVQTTVLGWLAHPAGSLAQLAAVAATVGVAISPQGLSARFTAAGAALLRAVLQAAVTQTTGGDPGGVGLLARFPAVVVIDSTTITLPDAFAATWPGCGGGPGASGAAIKATVWLDLCTGQIAGPEVSAGRQHDRTADLAHTMVPVGGVRISDLGYWSLGVFAALIAAGAHMLSRLHPQPQLFLPGETTPLSLERWLRRQRADQVELAVDVGAAARLPLRLLAARVPPDVAAERRRVLRAAAKRKGQAVSRTSLIRADWTLLVTSVPAEHLTLAEALVLARARWQIELLFKLWKTQGQIDASRSANPQRLLCELYAKLIAMVLQHAILAAQGWTVGDSAVRAALTVQAYATAIAATLACPRILTWIMTTLLHTLAATAPVAKRRLAPSTAQLLADPSLLALA